MADSDGGNPDRDQGKSLAELAQEDQADADAKTKAATEGQSADDADDQDAADQAGDGKGKESNEDDPLMVTKWFDEVTGSKHAENYANDFEFARSMAERDKLLGKRSDQDRLGQKVLDAFNGREDDLLKLLASGRPTTGKADADNDGPIEWNDSWVTQDENGKLVAAPGAPSDALDRYGRLQARYRELTTDPRGFMQRMLQPELEKLRQAQTKTNTDLEQERKIAEVSALCMANAPLLYINGDDEQGLTPQGVEVDKLVKDEEGWYPDMPCSTHYLTRVDVAIKQVAASKPTDRSRPAPNRARRKTDAAATAPAEKTEKQQDEDLKTKGLAAVLLEQHETRKAQAVGSH